MNATEYRPRRITLLNAPIDALNTVQTIAHIEQFIKKGIPRQHVVVNVAKIVKMRSDPQLREIVSSCDLINADGMPDRSRQFFALLILAIWWKQQ